MDTREAVKMITELLEKDTSFRQETVVKLQGLGVDGAADYYIRLKDIVSVDINRSKELHYAILRTRPERVVRITRESAESLVKLLCGDNTIVFPENGNKDAD